jgi:hypothetical protein
VTEPPLAPQHRPLLLLELRSGDQVALSADHWPSPHLIELRTTSSRPPAAVVAAFLEHTRYPPDRLRT